MKGSCEVESDWLTHIRHVTRRLPLVGGDLFCTLQTSSSASFFINKTAFFPPFGAAAFRPRVEGSRLPILITEHRGGSWKFRVSDPKKRRGVNGFRAARLLSLSPTRQLEATPTCRPHATCCCCFFKLDAFSPVGHIGPLRSRRGASFSGESKDTWYFPALRIRAAAWG